MVSGSSVYKQIKAKVSETESNLGSLGDKIIRCEDSITKYMNERENCYGQLAAVYLPDLDAASLKTTLKEVQADVQKIFEEKQKRRISLEEIMKSSQTERKKAEAELDIITGKLNAKVKEREKLTKIVSEEINKNKIYTETKSRAKDADSRLKNYEKTSKRTITDAENKLSDYKANKLFMYLADSNFGSSDYSKKGLIAKLDSWVAKVVNYEEGKKSYDILNSVPETIKTETSKKRRDIGRLVGIMQKITNESSDKNGLTKVMAEGTKLGGQREKLLKSIEEFNSAYSASEQERRSLDSTKNNYYAEAVGRLKGYLKGETIEDLKKKALETKDTADDNLVGQIEKIDLNIKELKENASGLKRERDILEERFKGLRSIQHKYSNLEYESGNSYFNSGFNIMPFLVGYLMGQHSQSQLWNHIEKNQNFESSSSYNYSSSSSSSSYSSSSHFSSGGGFGGGFSGGGGFSSGGGF